MPEENMLMAIRLSISDHPSAIGFIRTGDEEHVGSGLVFLMSNDEAGSKKMDLGEEHKGEIWHEITGNIQQEITLDEKEVENFLLIPVILLFG